ncbi:MAG: SDR family NAD(P)-dependent oxidoreductase [Candidatus Nanopelagicales bacterium]|nr:SDR family NAD(P)-dependent oxidoreductase [Candidatus Nanopelagicales bacterium]
MSRSVAIVLGAGMAGRAVARELGKDHLVIVVDRDAALAARAAEPVAGESAVVDLIDIVDVERFCGDVLARHGRIDAVVHLVGGWKGSTTVDVGALDAWKAIAPGVFGTVRTTTVAFRDALMASGGSYLIVSSTAAAKPTAGNVAYATAKSAAETWVGGLAHSFRESQARAVIVSVKALVDQDMREAQPDQAFPGYTDTSDLARTIGGVLAGDGANGDHVYPAGVNR